MCYDIDAAPPVYGTSITAARGMTIQLTSVDGTRLSAYVGQPDSPSGAGVMVLPDNRGLSGFYEQLCVRLAEQGHPAIAIDYYARTAGPDHRDRGAEFPFLEHLFRLSTPNVHADIEAAVKHLRDTGSPVVLSLGFCFGGRLAFLTAAPRFGLAGAVGLYGYPDSLNGAPGPTQQAAQLTAPILGLFGGRDPHIPEDTVAAFGAALNEAAVPHEIVTYPDAPHGFFDVHQHECAVASADAWRRILRFLSRG